MKDVIILEKTREKKGQLVMENKIKRAEVAKMSGPIYFNSQYIQAIKNADIDAAKDLTLTSVKKYWKRAGQIKKKVNGLHKDWISVLTVFVKYF